MLKLIVFPVLLFISLSSHAFGGPRESFLIPLHLNTCSFDSVYYKLTCPQGSAMLYNKVDGCIRELESKGLFSSKWKAGTESYFFIIEGENLSRLVGQEIFDYSLYYFVSNWYETQSGNHYAFAVEKDDIIDVMHNVEFKMGNTVYKFNNTMSKCALPEN